MRIHTDEIPNTTQYIDVHRSECLEDKTADFRLVTDRIKMFKELGPDINMLEIGIGTGWFPIMCSKNGLPCKGIEISPQLVEYALEFGRQNGVEPDIEVGNIEDANLGANTYDVIIALSVFEHVELWQQGLKKIYEALRPGGVFIFCSSNKFTLKSGEYKFPFYGWLPNKWRYRLRIARQGEQIMKLGIDFNQFTYGQLRRYFRGLGYAKVYDRFDLLEVLGMRKPKPWKKAYFALARRIKPLKHLALVFVRTTEFVCVK